MRVSRAKLLAVSALLVGLGETALAADPGVADQTLAPDTGLRGGRQWKLTLGDYQYSGYSGQDLNLRWQRNDTHAWLGAYTDRSFGTQAHSRKTGTSMCAFPSAACAQRSTSCARAD